MLFRCMDVTIALVASAWPKRSRNVARARLEIGRVLPQQLQHLAFYNRDSYAKPGLGGIDEDDLVEREELRLDLPADDPAKAHYEGVDLGKFLAPGRRGIFLLSLRTLSDADSARSPCGDRNSSSDSMAPRMRTSWFASTIESRRPSWPSRTRRARSAHDVAWPKSAAK